jgi:apolipoprotein N-acyltransferase
MDTPDRGARMLVYLVAIALMGFGVINLSLHWIESSVHHTPMRIVHFAIPAIFFVPGIVVLIKARSIAEWISNRLDE